MPFVKAVEWDGQSMSQPTWEAIQQAFERLNAGQLRGGLLLRGGDEAWLAASRAEGFGLYLAAIEDGELGEKFLVVPELGLEMEQTKIDGLPEERPRCALIPLALALEAARDFWESGRRTPRFTWRDPFELEDEARLAAGR